MIFLLDSNAFSDLMRKNARIEARLAALGPNAQVVICPIVRGEILYGIARLPHGRRRENLANQAASLFATIACAPVPADAADAYARIKLLRQRQGLSLDENDLWIAATASALGATLVTRDRDFTAMPDLTTVDWTV
ncbi:MAG: type II toxin-antitoxin system VapC family toxin [Deltaproteobacteria bacterium]|nr:type II toxin-antitoxin system VapC family toxin [Deltaproteobacteria bacterium]